MVTTALGDPRDPIRSGDQQLQRRRATTTREAHTAPTDFLGSERPRLSIDAVGARRKQFAKMSAAGALRGLSGLSGFSAVALGAYGAHGLKPDTSDYQRKVWERATT